MPRVGEPRVGYSGPRWTMGMHRAAILVDREFRMASRLRKLAETYERRVIGYFLRVPTTTRDLLTHG